MPKYVLKRKYKNYTDPYAQEWYNSIFSTSDFEKSRIEDAQFRGGNRLAEKERLELKQAALNAADYVESLYRYHQRKYKAQRDSVENNPNFIGPKTPSELIPQAIRQGLQFSNYDSRIFGPQYVIQTDLLEDYDKYKLGGIYIKPENRGKFTAWAENHNMGVQEAANHILANKDDYPSTLVRRANFAKNFGGRKKAALGTQYPLIGGVQPLNFTVPTFTPEPGKFSHFLGNFGLNTGDLAATGVQLVGNLASSLINNAAINRLRFTPIHTQTVAEAPVKFNTTYNINPQLDNLRESIGSVEREAANNSASSRTAYGRIANTRFRGIGAYNELYGQKLNQETAMLNTDAQNRQNVRARNANRLQQNIARDTIYNAQGEDNLNNTKATLKGQNWSNFVQQLSGSLIGTYNRGQQRISDANSLAYLYASDPNAARLFMNNNSLIRRIFETARGLQGINI